ncbi:arylamine N-acetyltransferase [Nocardiopsis sp. FIRDI 009]|uniref:arylamine N-acetyltransferase family protein n=1 Tax=Nocardiopsis sp. FIRDI 009 TaxID=714197 RepID=UPI000E268E2A|nr:arylamine N-acetyltransferase [Nocardiopsis sp. FIRDI 009]
MATENPVTDGTTSTRTAPPEAPRPDALFTERDFWRGRELDLELYLERIGLAGDLPPTLDTLRALHRAHLAAIPFENLQIVLGRPILLDVPALTDKMVRRRRGGYCYEQNLLFASVLDRLGFTFTALSARVLVGAQGHPRPSTHALLKVDVDGTPWLADVGFGGGGMLEPFPFVDGHQARQGGWGLRLDRVDDISADEWLLRGFDGAGWGPLYSFTTDARLPQDYAIFSHYLASHPRSPFTGRLMAQTIGSDVQRLLMDTTLSTIGPDGSRTQTEVPVEEVGLVLDEVFGIGLDAGERAGVEQRLREFTKE